MPGGDRTGPSGHGPRTGRALGYCVGNDAPGYTNPGYGPGLGRGRGRSFGRGFWGRGRGFLWRDNRDPYYMPHQSNIDVTPQMRKDEEKTYLEDTIKSLEEEIKLIRDRLQELSKEKK